MIPLAKLLSCSVSDRGHSGFDHCLLRFGSGPHHMMKEIEDLYLSFIFLSEVNLVLMARSCLQLREEEADDQELLRLGSLSFEKRRIWLSNENSIARPDLYKERRRKRPSRKTN